MDHRSRSAAFRQSTSGKPRSRIVRRAAWFSALIALLLIALSAWTLIATDAAMHPPRKELAVFSANDMPSYSPVSIHALNGQGTTSGWFFPASGSQTERTVLLVHDQGSNRLVYGLETATLLRHLTHSGFNVLAFDQRNSGQSSGTLSAFGYAEWQDVLAAVQWLRKSTATKDVLLYGVGSGVAAALLAWRQTPEPGTPLKDIPASLRNLTFDRGTYMGLILDGASPEPDDYIRAWLAARKPLAESLLHLTVPYAIRLSAGGLPALSTTAELSRCQLPVLLIYHTEDTLLGDRTARAADERKRLWPDLTMEIRTNQAGHLESLMLNPTLFIEQLSVFLSRHFPAAGKN